MSNAIFMSSTPLHSLWSLAIAAGAFADDRCALLLIDQREGDRDFVAEVIADDLPSPFVQVRRFGRIGKRPLQKLRHARERIAEVKQFASQFEPDYVAVGNDRRVEFHAALAAAPKAMGAYVDDGAASYSSMPAKAVARSGWQRALANCFRSLMYGIPTEREPYIGISNAASEAWVMLPDQVHDGLRRKPLKEIRPEWFQLPLVQQVCVSAIERAGLAHSALREIRLFLALPHDVWMREHPQVRDRLQQFLDDAIGRGEKVAIKRHPLSREMLLNLPAAGVVEIPSRLPIEILAPLLPGAEIVGLLTSALLYLPRLGADIHVASFIPPNMTNNPIVDIYRKAGVRILA